MTTRRGPNRARWVTVGAVLAAAAAVAVVLIVAGPAAARQAGTSVPSAAPSPPASGEDPQWILRYDFSLEVDGKPSPEACFYQERSSRRILISAPDLPKACIINQDGKRVTAIDRGKVKIEGGGDFARLVPDAEKGAPSASYTIDTASVVFYVGANRLKILPKQPLVGPATADEILRHSPLYRKGKEAYTPEAGEIAYLKSWATPIDIEIFFGTWCSHCKLVVPRFMKVIEVAANRNLRVSYHGVPVPMDNYEPVRVNGVKGIPTFIFRREGREVSRIPGEPTNGTMEHALAEILRSVK